MTPEQRALALLAFVDVVPVRDRGAGVVIGP